MPPLDGQLHPHPDPLPPAGEGVRSVHIRPGRDEDAPGFIDLIGACWAEYATQPFDVVDEAPEITAFASYVANAGGALWVAEQASRVVGMIATYPGGDGWVLSRVYVDAQLRGAGLAQRLLRLAEDHARAAGAARMTLWSDVLFTRAHAFYEKHGYVRRGGLRPLPGQPDIIEAGFAKPLAGVMVEPVDIAAAESAERALAAILCDCVREGAPVPFLPPLAMETALIYWRSVTKRVGAGTAQLLVAWLDGVLAGAVHLDLDMPANQQHRAELRLLLVSPALRRRGLGHALIQAAEQAARGAERRLLVATVPAASDAERLYRNLAWQEAGTIPGYALDERGLERPFRILWKS